MNGATARLSPELLAKTACAMAAFASNSLLCRFALREGAIDAGSFTAIRLGAGAMVLLPLWRSRDVSAEGSWRSALALFTYAGAFSFAYLRLPAGLGALVLFAAVQATMVGGGLLRGERLTLMRGLGFAVAAAGLVMLTLPGAGAPDLAGAVLMAAAGIAWGVYSLRGAGATDAVAATAGNFARTVPLAALLALACLASAHVTLRGALIAASSGALASALGYVLWYGAVRRLLAFEAALVQLSVPVIAAFAGVLLLSESMTPRAIASAAAILIGIAIALRAGNSGAAR